MTIDILTLFPDIFPPVLSESILGRAQKTGAIDVRLHDIRQYTLDKHRKTDDYPYGGGAGMVMLAQPVMDCIETVDPKRRARRIYLSPRGRRLNQGIVEELAKHDRLLLLCGHYEGVDQRAIDTCIDEELSIGDYVLSGGELAAMVLVDAVGRLQPGALGSAESAEEESFTMGLLEYPQYTRPAEFRGMAVPDVLLRGVHADITQWRREQSLTLTVRRRPELIKTSPLDDRDRDMLRRLEIADRVMSHLQNVSVSAHRMSFLQADAFPRIWLETFVRQDRLKDARKACLARHGRKGDLTRAFTEGYIEATGGLEALSEIQRLNEQPGLLYLPEARVLLSVPRGGFDFLSVFHTQLIWIDEAATQTWCMIGQNGMGPFYAQIG